MGYSCKIPLNRSFDSECSNDIPLLLEEMPHISGIDYLGNVYDSNHSIIGWWIEEPGKTIRAKMYESGMECSLKIDK